MAYEVNNCPVERFNGVYDYIGKNLDGFDYYRNDEGENPIYMVNLYYRDGQCLITENQTWFNQWHNCGYPNESTSVDYWMNSEFSGFTNNPYIGYGDFNGSTLITTLYMSTLPEIFTASDLQIINSLLTTETDVYSICDDIDCNGIRLGYGSSGTPFKASILGQNHTLSNLNNQMVRTDYVGAFIDCGENCSIYNLTITGYAGGEDNVGVVFGKYGLSSGDHNIYNVHVKPSGYHSESIVEGRSYTGGLIGYVISTGDGSLTVKECTAEGRVDYLASDSNTLNSTARGIMFGNIRLADGNVKMLVEDCHVTGEVHAHCTSGGFIGLAQTASSIASESEPSLIFRNCSAENITMYGRPYTNNISDYRSHGLFVGRQMGNWNCSQFSFAKFENCWAAGTMDYTVNNADTLKRGPRVLGGFTGGNNDWCLMESCWCEVYMRVSPLWYVDSKWGHISMMAGGFSSSLKWGSNYKNCYCKGTMELPDWSFFNHYYCVEAYESDEPELVGSYTKYVLDYIGSSFANDAMTHCIVRDSADKYWLVDMDEYQNYTTTGVLTNGYAGYEWPIAGGEKMFSTVTWSGVGTKEGKLLRLKPLASTQTQCPETGGFFGVTFGAAQAQTPFFGNFKGDCYNCISYMDTTNVMGGFIDQYYSTVGRCDFNGSGNYYDKTLNSDGIVPADYASSITGLSTEELKLRESFPELDFSSDWYISLLEAKPKLRALAEPEQFGPYCIQGSKKDYIFTQGGS